MVRLHCQHVESNLLKGCWKQHVDSNMLLVAFNMLLSTCCPNVQHVESNLLKAGGVFRSTCCQELSTCWNYAWKVLNKPSTCCRSAFTLATCCRGRATSVQHVERVETCSTLATCWKQQKICWKKQAICWKQRSTCWKKRSTSFQHVDFNMLLSTCWQCKRGISRFKIV